MRELPRQWCSGLKIILNSDGKLSREEFVKPNRRSDPFGVKASKVAKSIVLNLRLCVDPGILRWLQSHSPSGRLPCWFYRGNRANRSSSPS